MSRLLILGRTIALLLAAGCQSSTGSDCPPDALDCGQPPFRIYELTVRVTSEGGTAVLGAAVRVEAPSVGGSGIFRTETTDAEGNTVFGFSYQGDALRPPMPIEILVTPPPGSPLSASAVSDTVVVQKTDTYRVLPVVLAPLNAYRQP